ncbi:hypothetical protein [Vibrio phage RYC]|nr:hypothetical protein [Vibrio phage RYC]
MKLGDLDKVKRLNDQLQNCKIALKNVQILNNRDSVPDPRWFESCKISNHAGIIAVNMENCGVSEEMFKAAEGVLKDRIEVIVKDLEHLGVEVVDI